MVKAIATGRNPKPAILLMAAKTNINEMKQMIMICPATIFANSRIIKAVGLIKIPANSTGIKISLIKKGTSGGQKRWDQ